MLFDPSSLLESDLKMSKFHAKMVSSDENVSHLSNLFEQNEHFLMNETAIRNETNIGATRYHNTTRYHAKAKTWARSIRAKFPEIPVQSQIEQKISGNAFRQFRSTSRGCPFSGSSI